MKLQFSAFLLSLLAAAGGVHAGTPLVDLSGSYSHKVPSDLSTSDGVVAVVSSPGTPSLTGANDNDAYLSLLGDNGAGTVLACRGATLSASSTGERLGLCTSSLIAGAIVVEGITEGDVEQGLRHSRHARSLTALFRAKLVLDVERKQTLLLGVMGDAVDESAIQKEVAAIFDAVAAETDAKESFADLYDMTVVSLQSQDDQSQVLATAQEAAKAAAADDGALGTKMSDAQTLIRESGVATAALDSPMVAQAFLTCRNAYAKQAKTARAKISAWKARVARGLLVDGFGTQAETLLTKTLGSFDSDTLSAAGLRLVAKYRLEIRTQLQAMLETSLEELYEQQVVNLEKYTLKKLSRQLLSQMTLTAESNVDADAVAMRNAAFAFDTGMESLQLVSLNLVKDRAVRDMTDKLTNAVNAFADSPQAQLKRTAAVTKTTSKEKKPTQRAVDFGLDIVAMIRPDGFGSLQGFAGYSLGGNSVTVGVANDADDPQVIAQMGGVRPPLIRVQPKLRVDVEL